MTERKPIDLIKAHLAKRRFKPGSHHSKKLSRALSLTGNKHLIGKTLLTRSVHEDHFLKLKERYHRKFSKVVEREQRMYDALDDLAKQVVGDRPTESSVCNSNFRMLTLIDSVTYLSVEHALDAAKRMKEELQEAFASGGAAFACLGCVEIEIISMKMMRRISDLKALREAVGDDADAIDQYRVEEIIEAHQKSVQSKLEVCEILARPLEGPLFPLDSGLCLIHFHGVVTATKESKFELLRQKFAFNPRWSLAPRQIEIKKLSEYWGTKEKSPTVNLTDMARYFTKGGNDWNNKSAYLRYKLNFSNSMPLTDAERDILRFNKDSLAVEEESEEDQLDPMSLSSEEIAVLARCVHEMMNWKKDKTGYLLTVGHW